MRNVIREGLNWAGEQPFRTIEVLVGGTFMLNGLYVMSSFYHYASTSPLAESGADLIVRTITGAVYFLAGMFAMAMAMRKETLFRRRTAAMTLFLIVLFSFIFRVLTLGFHPSAWIHNFMLLIVITVDWLHINKKWLLLKE